MALELVGGALLSAFLQVSFEKLASPQILDFFRGRKLDEKLLSKLEMKLQSIHALADDAEQKQFVDPRVRDWLLKVKDVVLDAEDILDEIQYELSKCEVEAEYESQTSTDSTWKVLSYFKSHSVSSSNKEIKSRMEKALDSLEFLSSQKGDLGLRNVTGVGVGSGLGSEVSQKSPSTSLVVESVIYGRDDEKEMIYNWLASNNTNKLSILSIVGMGGLGKTTLAQHVYNDPRIDDKFDIKAWVCVSDDFNIFNLTRTILEAITKSIDDSRDREMVQGRLKEKLTGKKFLIILDDVWNRKQKEWKDLKTPLNYGALGSKIVVTTRDMKVASTMESNMIHPLNQLQGDHCWQMFAKHAFQDDNPQPNPDFKDIGMKIVEKCKGLPLALTTIGSLLHKKTSISEWESVLKSEIWELSEEDSDIVPTLRLSYYHLPPHLKRCFAYSALFPKDYKFDKTCLIQLWMAENFLGSPQQSKSLEEVGEQYFNDLLSRSFFQQSSFNGETCFVMHNLLIDLAKYVCGDICFRLEVDQAKNIPNIARHFSVATSHVKYFDGFGTFYDTRRLRTFLPTSESLNFIYNRWHCKMSISELFSKFKFLRVLSLSHYSNLSVVPESVGNLKHLRSLDLSNTSIYSLPESTCYLYNLQILKLNYITMIELPTNLHKLTDLRYLELIKTKVRQMPRHLEKLKNLRVFISSFDVEKGREFSMKQLGELNLQGGLSIENLQNIENLSDALVMDLKNKQHLVELELKWDRDQDPDDSMTERDEIVIEKLQPPKELEKLSINNYGGKQFPRWLSDNSLWNVVSLMLMNCQSCQYLPSLGLLPFLKHLTVARFDRLVSIDADFYGSSSCSFVSLETLSFYCMKEWEKWECESVTGSFPRLEELYIDGCPKLEGHLPMQLVHLKTLNIFCCEQLLGDDGCLGFDELFITISGHKMEAWLVEWICQMISCTSLEYLNIFSCRNMNILMSSCNNFLVTLKIHNSCDSLAAFPLDVFPKLQLLSICGCRNLQRISQDQSHNHLKDLTISNSPQFESLSECMHILPSLDVLRIEDCPKLESFPEGGLPPNLKVLFLREIPSLQCLPEGLCHLSSLQTLTLRNCSTLQFLPDDLCRLSSLKELVLNNCPNVQCLPNSGLPKSISYLEISGNCPLLRQSCLQDPTKVAQIQRIHFKSDSDFDVYSDLSAQSPILLDPR